MTLADTLRAAYGVRLQYAHVTETDGEVTVQGSGYLLHFSPTEPMTVAVQGIIKSQAYYALGLADEATEGAISGALQRAGRVRDAQQVRYSLDAIQAGRGPIYAEGKGR